jgi:lipoprotein-releasing system permease protein
MAPSWRNFSIWLGWQWGKRSPKLHRANGLATAVIAAGVFTVVVGIATGDGLQQAIDQKVDEFHGSLQIRGYQQQPTSDALEFTWDEAQATQVSSSLSDQATEVLSASFKGGMASHGTQMIGAQLMGVSALPKGIVAQKTLGSLPEWPSNEVWISSTLAQQLNVAVDSSFEMYFSRDAQSLPTLRYFTVAGIYETGLVEWDAQTIFCHERQVQKLNRWEPNQHQALLLYRSSPFSEEARAALLLTLPVELGVYSARDDYPQLYQWLDLFDTNTWLLGVILTLVAAFNAAVVIFIRIIERRKSVAILRTMGLSSGRLMISILTLFSRSILWGLLYGNLLAFSLLWAQDRFKFLPLDPQTYYVDAVPVAWNWVGFLLANLLIFIAVLLTSLVPAKILSKILPSQVLRMQ